MCIAAIFMTPILSGATFSEVSYSLAFLLNDHQELGNPFERNLGVTEVFLPLLLIPAYIAMKFKKYTYEEEE